MQSSVEEIVVCSANRPSLTDYNLNSLPQLKSRIRTAAIGFNGYGCATEPT